MAAAPLGRGVGARRHAARHRQAGAHSADGRLAQRHVKTWLLEAAGYRVYFAADTLLSPEVRAFAAAAGPVDLLLPPVHALHAVGQQVVMTAEEAAVARRPD